MFSLYHYLFGYDDEYYRWDEKQRAQKYKVLKEIENKIILLNHIHNDLCKCYDKNENKIIDLKKKRKKFLK